MKKSIYIILSLLLAVSVLSCKKKKKAEEEEEEQQQLEESFDKAGMLSNTADNIILISFNELKTSLDSLESRLLQFEQGPEINKLNTVRQKLQTAYKKYEHCSPFEFGPSETEYYRTNCNTFPADLTQINNNISSGTYDLAAAGNMDAKGFPAFDYLLYGNNTSDSSLLVLFTSDANAAKRIKYLKDIVSDLKTKTNSIINQWNSTYRSSFIANTGTDVSGSISLLVNQLNYEMDLVKNAKVGIPLGKQTLGTPLPEKCEGYYGKYSLALLKESITSIENIYLGRSNSGSDGKGLDEYLIHLKSPYGSGLLSDAIKSQFSTTISKLNALSDPLSTQISSNTTAVEAAYTEIQRLLVFLKTDMPSAMSITITYQDNDGD